MISRTRTSFGRPRRRLTALSITAVLVTPTLAACASGDAGTESAGKPKATDTSITDGPTPASGQPGGDERETDALTPRLLMSHDGGLTLLDADSGKVLQETKRPGFTRLANAGNGRHVMVIDTHGFGVYDTGIHAVPHGDHAHNYSYTPGLTKVRYAAEHAGHVVPHGGRTALFADGTGTIKVLDTDQVAHPKAEVAELTTDDPHHGVAVELADGSVLTTEGTEDERHTVKVLESATSDEVLAETTDCPGVHGEAVAAPTNHGEVVMLGCENGPVVYRDGEFHKVDVEEEYQRSGNLAGSHDSPIVLGDYKVDKDAELERPTRVALFDTRFDTAKLVELGSPYWFRSLARGPEGEALVLTYDGKLHILDEETGDELAAPRVVSPWREKTDWQLPGPAVKVAGDLAYVTDAAKKKVTVVDVGSGKVVATHDLPHTPVEFAVVTGEAEAPEHEDEHDHDDHEGHDHGDHEHEGHDHDH